MSIPNFTSGWLTEYKPESAIDVQENIERKLRYSLTIFIKKVILKEVELADLPMRDIYISWRKVRWTLQVINERRVYETYTKGADKSLAL
jgi:hypothetical protein